MKFAITRFAISYRYCETVFVAIGLQLTAINYILELRKSLDKWSEHFTEQQVMIRA